MAHLISAGIRNLRQKLKMDSYGQHLPLQPGLIYEIRPEVIHNIVQLWYWCDWRKITVNDIARITGVPACDVIAVINQERRNIAEMEQFKREDEAEEARLAMLPYFTIRRL